MSGELFAWGFDKENTGILGLGDEVCVQDPKEIKFTESPKILYVDTGSKHAGAIDDNGNIYIWGKGRHGELGVSGKNVINSPERVISCDVEHPVLIKCK